MSTSKGVIFFFEFEVEGWIMESLGWMMESLGWMMESLGWMMESLGWMMESLSWMMESLGWITESRLNDGVYRLHDGVYRLNDGVSRLNDGVYRLKNEASKFFFSTQFLYQAICTQRTLRVIVGSTNMGYVSDTARTRTRNLFHPMCTPIPLSHSDGSLPMEPSYLCRL